MWNKQCLPLGNVVTCLVKMFHDGIHLIIFCLLTISSLSRNIPQDVIKWVLPKPRNASKTIRSLNWRSKISIGFEEDYLNIK